MVKPRETEVSISNLAVPNVAVYPSKYKFIMHQFLSCLGTKLYYYFASVFCLISEYGDYFTFFYSYVSVLCYERVLYVVCGYFFGMLCIFIFGFRGLCMLVSILSPKLSIMIFVKFSASWIPRSYLQSRIT